MTPAPQEGAHALRAANPSSEQTRALVRPEPMAGGLERPHSQAGGRPVGARRPSGQLAMPPSNLRFSLHAASVLATAVILSFLSAFPTGLACPFLLRGWSNNQSWQLAEKVERADIVAIARVVSSDRREDPKGKVKTYSADCRVLEVSKGLPLFTSASGLAKHRANTVFGFGSAKECRSEVLPGRVYFMMLTVRSGRLFLSGIPAVIEFSAADYNTVRNVLGWNRWSAWSRCSAACGDAGEKARNRTCTVAPCTYGTTEQSVRCNRWPCPGTVNISKRVSGKPLAQQLSFPGSDILPRRIAAGFSLSYAQRNRQRVVRQAAGEDEFRLIEIKAGAGQILSVQHFRSFIQIGLGTGQKMRFELPALARGPINVLIDFNATQVNVYINCFRYSRPLATEQRWARLATDNVTVKFDGKMEKLVEDFLITAQHNTPPAECDEEVASAPSELLKAVSEPPALSSWSPWTLCSASCGAGMQQRARSCKGGPEKCLRVGERLREVQPCLRAPCSDAPAFPLPRTNAVVPCIPPCRNGGSCLNGQCLCPLGFHGVRCQLAVCVRPCHNGGICVRPNLCACPKGYGESDCSRPICPRGCRNNGQCVAPRKCLCQVGFRGRRCQHILCIPGCQNGGKCIFPNVCSCRTGTYGQYCEKYECFPNCMNGGKCIGRNKCKCPKGFYGKHCHRVRCRQLCRNGGRCTRHGICRCPRGFFGPQCESKTCSPELKYRQINKPTIKSFYETSVRVCGKRRKKYCSQRRLRSVVVYKIVMKPYFTCMVT